MNLSRLYRLPVAYLAPDVPSIIDIYISDCDKVCVLKFLIFNES